ncbi:protein serine/threonine phosphatase 2C [Pholiota conissans]|uniref:Protein serine/threonine phosphatase 2C n=1 Tax=Pholiota conissans TaxID=109636 RepID=A0A9P6CXI9_9AGAR|nr:protein serine/threonine phosphatase 2C [Pholiota conissans]
MFKRLTAFALKRRPIESSQLKRMNAGCIREPVVSPSICYKTGATLFFGVGAGVALVGFFVYSSTVHADAGSNRVAPRHGNGEPLPRGIRGLFCTQTNSFGEDRISTGYAKSLGYYCIGIYDGHNGCGTAETLSALLPRVAIKALSLLYSWYSTYHSAFDVATQAYLTAGIILQNNIPPDILIDLFIRTSFLFIDKQVADGTVDKLLDFDDGSYEELHAYINTGTENALPTTAARPPRSHEINDDVAFVRSSSCAIVGLFNTVDRSLRVGLVGDSRAVLGRRIAVKNGGQYEAHILTVDQSISNPIQIEHLTADSEHPDRPHLLKGHRATRAFGDGSLKFPVVTTLKDVKPGDFAVFASGGLSDCLTSEEVIGLVGQWLEQRGTTEFISDELGNTNVIRVPSSIKISRTTLPNRVSEIIATDSFPSDSKTCLPSELPVIYPPSYNDTTMMYKRWSSSKKFVCVDDDVVVHLMRNALGGANHELRSRLMSMNMPEAGKHRDDITITVLFFD